ncbi:WG repeat-containing protein [Cohnella ginsengisoli]|uniref:WG repeat-containing protein n=1 Tax=Cohnella ginsengisoli TaxID=425004 RepID=A0A9X4KFS0_9BACL|nr:WG repeat-containing protein [Cohnella ginsengisoli]MDG0789422.1 WG repeat-containing protein [Cohnella ginsengisoli]
MSLRLRHTIARLMILLLGILLSAACAQHAADADTNESKPIFTDVAGEYYHFLALDTDGNVWGWGTNIGNQLGEADQSYLVVPAKIKGIDDVKLISAGYGHSTAVKKDGTVWKWGSNAAGALGVDPDKLDFTAKPMQVQGIDHVKAIADSAYYTLALKEDGTVWGWGANDKGQLGIGRFSAQESQPVQIQSLPRVTAIYAAFNEGYAVTSDGNVWRWGAALKCDGVCKEAPAAEPVRFEGLSRVQSLSDEIAILQDGTVAKWGINYEGSLGTGSTEYAYLPEPERLPSLKNIVKVSKTHALTTDGQVWAWGRNDYGQIGDGTKKVTPKPILLNGIDQVIDITSGEEVIVALKKDGTLYEWGSNRNGEISNAAADILPPTPVPFTVPTVNYALPIPRDPGTWTFLDEKGNIIKDNQLYLRVKPFSEGKAAVQRASNNLWTFIKTDGKPAFSDNFLIVKDFHQDRAGVKRQDGWHFIRTDGKPLNQDRYANVDSFANGLAPVLANGKWGYLGLDGKMKIKPQFAAAQRFENGLAAVQTNGKWGFIDSTGRFIVKTQYAAAGAFAAMQMAPVKQNGKWGYIDKSGAWKIKPRYEDAKSFSSAGLAPVKLNGKWGYAAQSGKLVIAAQYEDASPFQEGLASVKKNGLWAVIQRTGKVLTPFQFTEIHPYQNHVAWAVTKTDNGYLDTTGKWYFKMKIQKW